MKPRLTDAERARRSERMRLRMEDPAYAERVLAAAAAAGWKKRGKKNAMKRAHVRAKIRGAGNALARPEVKAKHLAAVRAYHARRRAQKEANE